MANSGGKSPTSSSQFFIVLSDDEKVLSKLKGDYCRAPDIHSLADRPVGKYVVFGRIREGDDQALRVLDRLNEVGSDGGRDEKPIVPVWIGSCGVC